MLIADRASVVMMLVPRLSTLVLAGIVALMVAVVMTPNVSNCSYSPNELMKIVVDKIASDWHARWMLKTDRTCPTDLVEVARANGAVREDLDDAWDRPLRFICMPDGGLYVYSLGEDGVDGTDDDIRSWKRRRRH
jgi:hypothetical protein